MKLISFLGNSEYKSTTYAWKDQEYETRLFPAAVAHFIKPVEILICATPTVEVHHNLADLRNELDQAGFRSRVLSIPEGRSETDLWEIFRILTDAVEPGEEVVFDITHSFRSLPFLSFLAVAYLRIARNVTVKSVLYGAYEASGSDHVRSPVFDLTPFVGLLDWTNAVNRFVETGDGGPLTQLLRAGMPSGARMGSDLEQRALGKDLKAAADSIESISRALRVTHPREVMGSAAYLAATLNKALPAISRNAPPFAVLTKSVIREYGQFGLEGADESVNWPAALRRQLGMAEWYIGHGQVVQAITLMREWVVSLLTYRFGAPMFDHGKGRRPVELALNNAAEKARHGQRKIKPSPFDPDLARLPQYVELRDLWNGLTDVRNDIAHVGMRKGSKKASALEGLVQDLLPRLKQLAESMLEDEEVQ